MMSFTTLLDHVVWADDRTRQSIAAIDPSRPERSEAERLYAHLAASEHVWLARIEGRVPEHPVWPDLSLDEAGALATASIAGLRRVVTDGSQALDRELAYRTSAGAEMRNTVADIVMHVALHGSYHRGQLALLTRQAGAQPAATDYIAFTRGVPVAGTV